MKVFALLALCVAKANASSLHNVYEYVCSQPIVSGPCNRIQIRYGYDVLQKKCIQFAYSGCGANSNNFRIESKCKRICERSRRRLRPQWRKPRDRVDSQRRVCFEPLSHGPCTDELIRYGYSARSGFCLEFKYGGCGGNSNNFRNESSCVRTCEVEGDFDTLFLGSSTIRNRKDIE